MQAELYVSRSSDQMISEELVNTITHGLGLLLVTIGAVPLYLLATSTGKVELAFACSTYSASLIAVYAASTLSHAIRQLPWKRHLRIWDQGLIYLMIAGTYTPFLAIYAEHEHCQHLLYAVWAIAFVGFFSKILLNHRIDAVATANYILLGWIPAMGTLSLVPRTCLIWLVVGGLCYTVGTIFLKNDQRVRYFHATWHLLVIAGTASHFYAIVYCLSMQTA
jgi:hemolysin III